MKLIQQDFKISSKIWFSISLLVLGMVIKGLTVNDYDTVGRVLFNIVGGIFLISLVVYNIYYFSFMYEFKQQEIIVNRLFGILGKRKYSFKDLKKIEYSINPKGTMDSINLYFENREYKSRISISMFQVELSKVRLFLYANVENFEELVEEKQRRFV